ncbi:nucleotidyl transferase AbiEii/AbiGii toxin family protein [Paraburkholderia sp. SIMBA_050]
MKIISEEQKELIDSITAEGLAGNLSAFVLEKDIHVTDALHALARLRHPHIQFVFCGGTSLSKAHGLIERMSEDVDLKVILRGDHGLSQSGVRNHLSQLKDAVIKAMTAIGFGAIEEEQRALNGNRYFASGWHYKSRYTTHTSLRPHLSLELTVRTPSFAVVRKPLGYLTDRWANREGEPTEMSCVAVEETLAEKVLSFLRRHAEHRAGVREKWDQALVRHIYDVYCIVCSNAELVDRAAAHFKDCVEYDRREFHRHASFVENPKQCMTASLTTAETEEQTRREYQHVLLPLIYGTVRPTFEEAFAVFKQASTKLLAAL